MARPRASGTARRGLWPAPAVLVETWRRGDEIGRGPASAPAGLGLRAWIEMLSARARYDRGWSRGRSRDGF